MQNLIDSFLWNQPISLPSLRSPLLHSLLNGYIGGMPQTQTTTIYIDGNCPFCSREAAWLCGRKGGDGVQVVDIADAKFKAEEHGLDAEQTVQQLHARRADGSLVVGWEATVEALRATGSGRWTRLLYLPGVRHALNLGYRIFARNRVRWGNALLRWFPAVKAYSNRE